MFATTRRSARTGSLVFRYSSAQRCSSSRDIGTQSRRSKWCPELTRIWPPLSIARPHHRHCPEAPTPHVGVSPGQGPLLLRSCFGSPRDERAADSFELGDDLDLPALPLCALTVSVGAHLIGAHSGVAAGASDAQRQADHYRISRPCHVGP